MGVEDLKRAVGCAAVDDYVSSGMVVGLGTGSTAKHAVNRLGTKLSSGELQDIVAIPTSEATAEQARSLGIPLTTLDSHPHIDVAIDGADEVDSQLNLVKGRGAALLREKLVESASSVFVCVVDESKLMWRKKADGLGHDGAMPVEVVQFCAEHIRDKLTRLPAIVASPFASSSFRTRADGSRLITDNGNYIVDLFFSGPITNVKQLGLELTSTVGVVEHGLFLDMATVCLVASEIGVETLCLESEPPDSVSVNPRKKPKIDANPSLELVAVFEDKPRQTIGVAALSFRTAEVALHEFVDMSSYLFTLSVLRQYDPVRVVLPRLAVGSNALCNRLTSLYADNMTSVEEVHRKYFDVAAGEEIVGHHDLRGDATMATCALAALAAVVRFTEFHQDSVVLSHHLHIAFKSPTDSLFMNLSTVEHLELVMPRGTRGASVAGLFSCRTTSGTDLLRLSLLGPPTDRHVALGRQQLVTYFLEAGHVAARLRALLPKLQSLDSVGAQFVIRPQRKDEAYYRRFIRNAMELHESLLVCRELRELLTEEDSEGSVVSVARKPALLCDAAAAMDPQSLHQITGFLASSLDTNCATNSISQILHVVLPGRNTFLDATRAKYLQILDDLNFYVDGLKSKYQLLQIKLENSDSRGYYFSCPYNPNYTLPADFTWQTCKGSKVTFSTEALDAWNLRLREIRAEILLCVFEELDTVQLLVENNLTALHRVVDGVAQVDLCLAMADFALSTGQCIMPRLLAEGQTAIEGGRHPLLERSMSLARFVPLNLDAHSDCVHVVTSPNGGGKTTLLKTLAIIQILAQMGSPVPAVKADVVVAKQLLSRFGVDSDALMSTFQREMTDLAQVLTAVTPASLVLLDEVGRGTSVSDGIGISWATCEHLLQTRATALVATHYFELTRLAAFYGRARNLSLSCDVLKSSLLPVYRVSAGPSTAYASYGLQCAAYYGFPEPVLQECRETLTFLNAIDRQWRNEFFGDEEEAGFRLFNTISSSKRESLYALLCRMQSEVLRDPVEPRKRRRGVEAVELDRHLCSESPTPAFVDQTPADGEDNTQEIFDGVLTKKPSNSLSLDSLEFLLDGTRCDATDDDDDDLILGNSPVKRTDPELERKVTLAKGIIRQYKQRHISRFQHKEGRIFVPVQRFLDATMAHNKTGLTYVENICYTPRPYFRAGYLTRNKLLVCTVDKEQCDSHMCINNLHWGTGIDMRPATNNLQGNVWFHHDGQLEAFDKYDYSDVQECYYECVVSHFEEFALGGEEIQFVRVPNDAGGTTVSFLLPPIDIWDHKVSSRIQIQTTTPESIFTPLQLWEQTHQRSYRPELRPWQSRLKTPTSRVLPASYPSRHATTPSVANGTPRAYSNLPGPSEVDEALQRLRARDRKTRKWPWQYPDPNEKPALKKDVDGKGKSDLVLYTFFIGKDQLALDTIPMIWRLLRYLAECPPAEMVDMLDARLEAMAQRYGNDEIQVEQLSVDSVVAAVGAQFRADMEEDAPDEPGVNQKPYCFYENPSTTDSLRTVLNLVGSRNSERNLLNKVAGMDGSSTSAHNNLVPRDDRNSYVGQNYPVKSEYLDKMWAGRGYHTHAALGSLQNVYARRYVKRMQKELVKYKAHRWSRCTRLLQEKIAEILELTDLCPCEDCLSLWESFNSYITNNELVLFERQECPEAPKIAFLLLDYPGYGISTGVPCKQGIISASCQTITRTLSRFSREFDSVRLKLVAFSLGCAVALEVVALIEETIESVPPSGEDATCSLNCGVKVSCDSPLQQSSAEVLVDMAATFRREAVRVESLLLMAPFVTSEGTAKRLLKASGRLASVCSGLTRFFVTPKVDWQSDLALVRFMVARAKLSRRGAFDPFCGLQLRILHGEKDHVVDVRDGLSLALGAERLRRVLGMRDMDVLFHALGVSDHGGMLTGRNEMCTVEILAAPARLFPLAPLVPAVFQSDHVAIRQRLQEHGYDLTAKLQEAKQLDERGAIARTVTE